jgi:hypothetical protein
LNGKAGEVVSAGEAMKVIEQYSESQFKVPPSSYQVIIRSNTGDKTEASFKNKKDCVQFLESHKQHVSK